MLHFDFERAVLQIKEGENLGSGIPISNEDAGLYLMAFDLKEPWGTHRAYQVFREKYDDIFARPEVTADRIVLCKVLFDGIKGSMNALNNKLAAKYVVTQYFMLYALRLIVESDPIANEMLVHPDRFVRNPVDRGHFQTCMSAITDDIVTDLNITIDDAGPDFDYRDKFRDVKWAKALAAEILGMRQKLVRRKKLPSIKEAWDNRTQ